MINLSKLSTEQRNPNSMNLDTEDDWINCFREQFNKNIDEGISSKKYNLLRDKNTPTWETIARHCGVFGWKELMKKAQVQYPERIETVETLTITSISSPSLEKYENLAKVQKDNIRQLKQMNTYSKKKSR